MTQYTKTQKQEAITLLASQTYEQVSEATGVSIELLRSWKSRTIRQQQQSCEELQTRYDSLVDTHNVIIELHNEQEQELESLKLKYIETAEKYDDIKENYESLIIEQNNLNAKCNNLEHERNHAIDKGIEIFDKHDALAAKHDKLLAEHNTLVVEYDITQNQLSEQTQTRDIPMIASIVIFCIAAIAAVGNVFNLVIDNWFLAYAPATVFCIAALSILSAKKLNTWQGIIVISVVFVIEFACMFITISMSNNQKISDAITAVGLNHTYTFAVLAFAFPSIKLLIETLLFNRDKP